MVGLGQNIATNTYTEFWILLQGGPMDFSAPVPRQKRHQSIIEYIQVVTISYCYLCNGLTVISKRFHNENVNMNSQLYSGQTVRPCASSFRQVWRKVYITFIEK